MRIITEEQAYSNLKVVFKQESAHGKALGIFICTFMTSVSLWQFLQRPCDEMTPSVMVMVKVRVFSRLFCHVCQQQKNMTQNKSIHFNFLLFSSLTWLEDGGNCMALLWWLLTYAICWMHPSCTSFPNLRYYSFSQLLTHKKRKFGTICTTFTSCTNRSTQFGTTSHSLICIRLTKISEHQPINTQIFKSLNIQVCCLWCGWGPPLARQGALVFLGAS